MTAAAAVGIASQKPAPKLADVAPASRLITQAQYLNTLKAIFGPGVNYPSQSAPVKRVGGLVAVGTGSAVITSGALDRFDGAGRTIAEEVFSPSHRGYALSCRPNDEAKLDDKCAGKFLGEVGRLLFRRPLSKEELQDYVTLANKSAVNLGGFYQGLSATLAGMLIAPEFLYTATDTEEAGGQRRLTGYAKATRLSLLLWNAYPDSELLAAAENGSLNSDKGIAKQVDRMLNSPQLADGVRNFFEDMLVFENFETLTKDAKIYPAFTAKVVTDAHEQTLRTIIAHVVDENADYRDLFTTRKTFLTNDLAAVYGVSINRPQSWVPYEFAKDSPRGGLLSQPSFLAIYAHPGRSSPTKRGRAIREIFLCQTVPNPPPNVDFSKLERPDPSLKTARMRLASHSSNPVCAGCHKLTDPIGLALENFDGAGTYRAEENGATIDSSGQLDNVSYTDVQGLENAMRNNPRTSACLVERLSSYALGRELNKGDDAWLAYANETFAASGYRVKDMLRMIATSASFYATPTNQEKPGTQKADASAASH